MLKIKLLERKKEDAEKRLLEKEESINKLNERAKELEVEIESATDEEVLQKIEEEVVRNLEETKQFENEVAELRNQINEIDSEIVELRNKAPKVNPEGEKNKMNINEERARVGAYIRSKGIKRDKITSTEVGVLIPKEDINEPVKKPNKIIDLSQYVTKIKVNSASGTYPLLKRNKAVLSTVEELEKNPELAKPEFDKVDWKAETYRGAIPISQESIDDADCDIVKLVEEQAEILKINTRNQKICSELKKFTAKTVTKLDEIITLLDVDLDIAYGRTALMTQAFFNKIHIIKDKMGRYMWDSSIISNSQNEYVPVDIIVVPDEFLGAKNDAKAFIGDLEYGILLADRNDLSVKWVDNDIYGEILQAAIRFDVERADKEAGFFVTLNLTEV
jgi:phage major capsid protein, HK97 family